MAPARGDEQPAPRNPTVPRWVFGACLAVVAGLALLQAIGAFREADRRALDLALALRPAPALEEAPLLLAVDAASVERFGPLPWPPARWAAIGDVLADAGIHEVFVVDPWTRLLSAGEPPVASRAAFRVPRLVEAGPGGTLTSLDPPADRAPFVAWDRQLHLPPAPDRVVRDLAPARAGDLFGPSAFCAWARCPPGEGAWMPLRPVGPAGSLPTLSVAEVGGGPVARSAGRPILLGATAPFASDTVLIGASALPMPRAEAVGQAVASATVLGPIPRPGEAAQALLVGLAGILALGLVVLARGPRTTWIAIPLFVAFATLGAAAAAWIAPPVAATILAAGVPPLLVAAAGQGVSLDLLRRFGTLLAQDGFRYAWRESTVSTPRELLEKLGAVTRNRTSTSRMALVRRVPGTTRLEWAGGYGVTPDDLDAERLYLGSSPFREASGRADGAPAGGLLRDSLAGRILPLWQDRWLAAYWIPVWTAGAETTDPAVLARLARWMGRRLTLDDAPRPSRVRDLLPDRLDARTDRVQQLFADASEERRRQVQTLHALDLPLLTADVAGSVQFANRAMNGRLERAGLAHQPTLRGILFHLMGPHGFPEAMNDLFVRGRSLRLPWTTDDDRTWRVTVEPIHEEGGSDGEVLGYVMHLQDETPLVELQAIRASLAHATSDRVRDAQMHRLGGRAADDAAVPLDLAHLLREVTRDVAALAAARRIALDLDVPAAALPVLAVPVPTRDAVTALLGEACRTAAPGSTVTVRVVERDRGSEVRLAWPGAGLDPSIMAHAREDRPADVLPRELQVFARARAALPDLVLHGTPGRGVEVAFTLPRPESRPPS